MATDPIIRTLASGPEIGATMPVLFIGHGSPMNAIEDTECKKGAPIIGSGNIVHNLREMAWEDTAYDWALAFDVQMKELILSGNHKAIIHYTKLGRYARLAVPTPEHYLPLLYALGAQDGSDGVAFFADRVTLGSMSMRSVRIG